MAFAASQESSTTMIKIFVTFLILLGLPLALATTSKTTPTTTTTANAGAINPNPQGGNQAIASAVNGPLRSFMSTIHDARKHLVSAAVARGTCTAIMYPMDLIKTRIQVDHPNPFQLIGLFDGVGGSLLGQIPYGVLTFGSYEVYKEKLRTRFPKLKPAFRYAIAAVCGDLTGSICLCPSEVIKSNVQAGIFKTSTQAVTNIFKTKGLGGFYQGFLGLAARDIPFRVCQLTSYELIKNVYLKSNLKKEQQSEPQMESNLTPIESAAIGAIAGTFSAAITTPLDRIKTLLAINGNMSFTSCASMIFLEEGPLGFTRGLWPRICYVAPSVTIFFIVYEATHQHLKIANTIQSS